MIHNGSGSRSRNFNGKTDILDGIGEKVSLPVASASSETTEGGHVAVG